MNVLHHFYLVVGVQMSTPVSRLEGFCPVKTFFMGAQIPGGQMSGRVNVSTPDLTTDSLHFYQ